MISTISAVRECSAAPPRRRGGFTLVEVMVAATISGFVLAGVLAANLQIVRGGIRLASYVEMDSQVRRALDVLGRDLKSASAIKWNGTSDITLTIPAGSGTAQVTYAWTAASGAFFRVAGASSTTVTGRLELVRGIPTLADGTGGMVFARFDRDGVAATTDAATKSVQVTLTVLRSARTVATASQNAVSATFTLRSKSP